MPHSLKDSDPKKVYKVFQLYYPALITFIVLTDLGDLLKNTLKKPSLENILLVLLCICISIYLTGSWLRVVDRKEYPFEALLLDFLNILCVIYICSVSVQYSRTGAEISYLHLSIPFLIVSVSRFFWFVFMHKIDKPALLRICILFVSMLSVSCIELFTHSQYSLVAIVFIIALLAVFMLWGWSPREFNDWVEYLWIKCLRVEWLRKIIFPNNYWYVTWSAFSKYEQAKFCGLRF